MNSKSCRVHGSLAIDYTALRIDAYQVGHFNARIAHPERIHPEGVGIDRISYGHVASNALIEAIAAENAEGRGETLFAMQAFFFECLEHRDFVELGLTFNLSREVLNEVVRFCLSCLG